MNRTVKQTKPNEIEAWLNELGLPSADRDYKPGHERMLALILALTEQGFSFKRPKIRIRIAGTNGKGSTAHFVAGALQASGLQVGLYTSPHILNFNERIRIDGRPVNMGSLLSYMEVVMPMALKVQTSYFETATVLALMAFSDSNVDVEILEAGVGAKLDATTAVEADIGLLTSVALDHQDWLGSEVEEIAKDKSYVFEGCKITLSTYQGEKVRGILNERYEQISYASNFDMPLLMLGDFQRKNAGLAMLAMKSMRNMGYEIDLDASSLAIAQTLVPGRLEYKSYGGHEFWLDVAHNEHAVAELLPALDSFGARFNVIFLCTRKDRDLSACVPLLSPLADKVVVMTGAGEYEYQDIEAALEKEVSYHQAGRFLVLGSFVTIGEVMRWMENDDAI